MQATMWAVRKERPAPGLELVEVPVPAIRPDEVLVRVEAASVCGTDLHIYNWDDWARQRIRPPLVLGHELAGTVVEAGPLVRNARVGDYVSAESHVTCGVCFHCRTGRAHMCEQTRILGVDRDGAFAEYIAVPDSVLWQNDRAKLPPEIATLQEPFGNAVFAVGHADLAGKTVAVLGCGPVGLFSIGIARASGAGRIVASDTRLFRLDLARRMGAHEILDVSARTDAAEALVELNEGQHLDVVFEMSGAPEAIETAFTAARNGGRVILFGIPAHPVQVDVAEALIFKNLDVSAVSGRQVWDTWYRTRWLLEHGVVDLHPLVTAECGLDGFQHAFDSLASGDACKIVLRPQISVAEAAA
ncbi:MAG TPA: L-threonine 3-dehydrogenase [Gaiellaceae bacterium]|nr:L-threonine 3-dehydrogenase [Gaiellaceae bacterium]